MVLNCLRNKTLDSTFKVNKCRYLRRMLTDVRTYGFKYRFQKNLRSSRGFNFKSFGWVEPGIIGSGIPCLTRTEVWRDLGEWIFDKGESSNRLIDSSGGGEDEMVFRWQASKKPYHRIISNLPVAVDIITDEFGCKAKVRKGVRYGVYEEPVEGGYFYEIGEMDDLLKKYKNDYPVAFEDFVKPVGFKLPLDSRGDLIKSSMNMEISSPVL